jgi:hypothetical protein
MLKSEGLKGPSVLKSGSRRLERAEMRSPVWMLAYAVALVLLGATYAALVFLGSKAALIFALMALVAVVTAVVLVLKR